MEDIPQYIQDWLTVIEEMNNTNTYKLAWGRAIIECIISRKYSENDENMIIYFDDISYNILKYYWNQRFFFNLKQSPTPDHEPTIYQKVHTLIVKYKQYAHSEIPVWFLDAERVLNSFDKEVIYKTIKGISADLHKDVSWRFLNVKDRVMNLYTYVKQNSLIILKKEDVSLLKKYGYIISKLLNYRWAILLEKYNYSPKIITKVTAISRGKIERSDLSSYRDALLLQYQNKPIIDFYTGKEIPRDQVSIDHVIPWSYMYSDDIWNLVITSKSYNSHKSNAIPTEEDIQRLKERNQRLLDILEGKFYKDMKLAIQNDYVDTFYLGLRG